MNPSPHALHLTRHFPATPEQIFDAWLVPRTLGRWAFGHRLRCGRLDRLNLDPREGGQLALLLNNTQGPLRLSGSYQEIQRPQHLSFALSRAEESQPQEHIHIHITAAEDGCTLALRHDSSLHAQDPTVLHNDWNVLLDALSDLFPLPAAEPSP